MSYTQKQLILEWIKAHGDFMPSHMVGKVFEGQLYGSEIKRRCCEMRDAGILRSRVVGKFVVFELNVETPKVQQQLFNQMQLAI